MQSSDAERTLHNLHVLAALSHNDKLMTNDDHFDIYVPTALRGVMRLWYGERRGQNLQRVRQTVRSAVQFASASLEEASTLLQTAPTASEQLRLRVDMIVLQHARMCEALTEARGGLDNLKLTYRDDATLASQVSAVVSEIDDFRRVMTPRTERLRALLRDAGDAPGEFVAGWWAPGAASPGGAASLGGAASPGVAASPGAAASPGVAAPASPPRQDAPLHVRPPSPSYPPLPSPSWR